VEGSTWLASAWPRSTQAANVNVSRFGSHFAGAGGFINITQDAWQLVFAGTFTAGALKVAVGGGTSCSGGPRLEVRRIRRADHLQRTLAAVAGQSVLFITERCVVGLSEDGLELIEIALGIDLEREIST
jgi:propionate CoA-transferase